MDNQPKICEQRCACKKLRHNTKLVVLTGGPGAGKTAVLELVKKVLCEHVAILPEAASIVFGGGFWRLDSPSAKTAAQRAIIHIQREMENLVLGEKRWSMALCDRGLLDGFAYWPGSESAFWRAAGSNLEEEYKRYFSVIHLRSPSEKMGYNHENPLRIESAYQAQLIDEKIFSIWNKHPKYRVIENAADFWVKARIALQYIADDLPECCKFVSSEIPSIVG